MHRMIFFIGVIILSIDNFQAQEYYWELENEYYQEQISSWDVNPLGEVIIYNKRNLQKLDANFKLEFTQSVSSFGFISKIDAKHSLKTLLFSENQQMVGFVDNTLTFQEGKQDLANLDIGYAYHVCYSDNSNRFWVYDEQNSRLIRFQGVQSFTKQAEITNLAAITGESELPKRIIENANQLLVFYQGSGVFLFDYYGSLIRKIEAKEATQVYPYGDYIYLLIDNKLKRIHQRLGEELVTELPTKEAIDIRITENKLFILNNKGIYKYSLKVH